MICKRLGLRLSSYMAQGSKEQKNLVISYRLSIIMESVHIMVAKHISTDLPCTKCFHVQSTCSTLVRGNKLYVLPENMKCLIGCNHLTNNLNSIAWRTRNMRTPLEFKQLEALLRGTSKKKSYLVSYIPSTLFRKQILINKSFGKKKNSEENLKQSPELTNHSPKQHQPAKPKKKKQATIRQTLKM